LVNLEGSYTVSDVNVNTKPDYVTAPSKNTWEVRWNQSNDAAFSTPWGSADRKVTFIRGGSQSGCKNLIATMGVQEDGLYQLSWMICNNSNATAMQKVDILVDGIEVLSDVDAQNVGAPTGYVYAEKVITTSLPLAAGTHQIHIKDDSPEDKYYTVETVYLTKASDASYSSVAVMANAKDFAAKSDIGVNTQNANYPLLGSPERSGGWFDYTVNVPYDGMYTPSLTWVGGYAGAWSTAYLSLYVDGACVTGDVITDTTGDVGSSNLGTNDMVSTLSDCYLPAGTHTVRIYNNYGYFYIYKLELTRKSDATGPFMVPGENFDATKTSNVTADLDSDVYVGYALDGSYAHYYVNAPKGGYYQVSAKVHKASGTANITLSANGSQTKATVVGNAETPNREETLEGMVYLNKGKNDLTVRVSDGSLPVDYFKLTPVAWENRKLTPIPVELYHNTVADANFVTTVAQGETYTAVADFGGALFGKGATVVVAVYNGNTLVSAKSFGGTCKMGETFTYEFTVPTGEGTYTVKAFALDSFASLRPYTASSNFAAAE